MSRRVRIIVAVFATVAVVAGLGIAAAMRLSALQRVAVSEAAAYNRDVPKPTLDPYAGRPVVTVVGDDMSAVAQSARPTKEWPLIAQQALDVRIVSLSTSSSGYTSKPTTWTYGGTFVARALHVEPTSRAVVLFGGANDSGVRTSRVYDSAVVSIREAKEAATSATVVVVGPVHTSTDLPEGLRVVRDTLKRAAAASDVEFVDPIAQKWVDGRTGIFRKDGLTPTEAGQAVIATRMESVLKGVLR